MKKKRKTDIAVKEYMMLREEIMYLTKQSDTMAQTAYTMTFAVFTVAFHFKNSFLVFCALLFLCSFAFRFTKTRKHMAYIASYMKFVLEKELDFQWETYHYEYEYNKKNKYNQNDFLDKLGFSAFWDFLFLSIASCILFWWMEDFKLRVLDSYIIGILIILIQVVVIIFELYIINTFTHIPNQKKIMQDNWAQVERNLKRRKSRRKSKI